MDRLPKKTARARLATIIIIITADTKASTNSIPLPPVKLEKIPTIIK
jgi:hypothetical protein